MCPLQVSHNRLTRVGLDMHCPGRGRSADLWSTFGLIGSHSPIARPLRPFPNPGGLPVSHRSLTTLCALASVHIALEPSAFGLERYQRARFLRIKVRPGARGACIRWRIALAYVRVAAGQTRVVGCATREFESESRKSLPIGRHRLTVSRGRPRSASVRATPAVRSRAWHPAGFPPRATARRVIA